LFSCRGAIHRARGWNIPPKAGPHECGPYKSLLCHTLSEGCDVRQSVDSYFHETGRFKKVKSGIRTSRTSSFHRVLAGVSELRHVLPEGCDVTHFAGASQLCCEIAGCSNQPGHLTACAEMSFSSASSDSRQRQGKDLYSLKRIEELFVLLQGLRWAGPAPNSFSIRSIRPYGRPRTSGRSRLGARLGVRAFHPLTAFPFPSYHLPPMPRCPVAYGAPVLCGGRRTVDRGRVKEQFHPNFDGEQDSSPVYRRAYLVSRSPSTLPFL